MVKENKKKVIITLTPKAHEKMKRFTKKKHISVSGAIEDWIWNELEEDLEKKDNNKINSR